MTRYTAALASDGAAVLKKAAMNLEATIGILTVLCQVHAVNNACGRLCKDILCFKSLYSDAHVLLKGIRDVQCVSNDLAAVAKRSVF